MEEIKVSEMLQADSIEKDNAVMIIQDGVNKKASGSIQTATGTSLSLTSVADTCKITSNSKNMFDKDNPTPVYYANNASYSILENGIRIIKPASGATTVVFRIMDVSDKVGETFTLKADFTSGGQYIIGLCDVSGGNRIIGTLGTTGGEKITYTIPEITTSSYLAIWLYGDSDTTGNKDYTNIQVEEGSTATEYNPYNTEVMISKSKNVFNQKQIVNPPANTQGTGIVLQLLPNTEYTMSSNCPMSHGNTTLIFFASGTSISGLSTSNNGVWDGQTRTFTSDSNGNMVVAYRRNTTDTDIDLTDYWYQIEQGSTATTYEEYSDEIQRLALTPSEEKSAFTYDTKTIILSDGNITIEYNTQSRLLNNDDVLDIVEPVKEYVDRTAEVVTDSVKSEFAFFYKKIVKPTESANFNYLLDNGTMGTIYINELGTTKYYVGTFNKVSGQNSVFNMIGNNGITIAGSNASGTVVLSGATTNSNLRVCIIGCKMDFPI